MTERERPRYEEDPYYAHDVALGDVTIWDQNWMLRMRAHVGDEGYSRSKGEEIIELTQRRGTRSYVLAKPYLLQQSFTR